MVYFSIYIEKNKKNGLITLIHSTQQKNLPLKDKSKELQGVRSHLKKSNIKTTWLIRMYLHLKRLINICL